MSRYDISLDPSYMIPQNSNMPMRPLPPQNLGGYPSVQN